MEQEQRTDDTTCFHPLVAAFFAFGVQRRVQAQAQTEQGAHVTQEAGEGRAVQVDPLGSDAPLLGFLDGPQQVHTYGFEQQVEAHSKRGQEKGSVEVLLHAGIVDPLSSVEGLGHDHT